MKKRESDLGKIVLYPDEYNPDLLFPVPRNVQRKNININFAIPFVGADIWNAYEISWLNAKGKPNVAVGQFIFPCDSPNLIESKSLKMYLFSLIQTKYSNIEEVRTVIEKDLSCVAGSRVFVNLYDISKAAKINRHFFDGICLDDLDVECTKYKINTNYLQVGNIVVNEKINTNLMKSNCLITNQPDWASIQIEYTGPKINKEGLLKYLISYREHSEFHEQCVERIFMDLKKHCKAQKLSVYAKYTRRGGLDINPFRTTESIFPLPSYMIRQ